MDGIRFQNPMGPMERMGPVGPKSPVSRVGTDGVMPSPKLNTDNSGAASFADTLKQAIGNVNELQKTADLEMEKLATGQSQNLHETMIAAEKADIALKLMVQVRNKVIDAYHEIMKMQV